MENYAYSRFKYQMKWLIIVITLFTLNNVNGQNYRQQTQEVLLVVDSLNRAFELNEVENYFRLIDDDFSIYLPGNPYLVEGKQNDKEEFEHSLASGRTKVWYWQMFQPKVQLYDETAIVTFHGRGSFGPTKENSREVFLKITDVLVKVEDKWKFVHIHVSQTN